jgi:hypothetical protein
VVRANVDTLYSAANLDLGAEPIVLSVPATDRYFMLPLLSMWTEVFAVPGTRTTGRNTAREFLLVGPGWQGEAPSGLEIIRSPSRFVGIGGRIQTNGPTDYENVHWIQAGMKLTPLSAWGTGEYTPPKGKFDPSIDMKTPPPVQIEKMDALSEGGQGWVYTTRSGVYGVDYLYRAAIAYCCLGENLPQDAVYPSLSVDSEGQHLDGNSRYVLHFDKGQFPPVDAFWSVTAYDTEGYFIPNTLNRLALGDRDKLATNADGSLDLYVQAHSPGSDKGANWLPVAKAPFTLLMRLYSPKREVLDGSWTPPPVRRVN